MAKGILDFFFEAGTNNPKLLNNFLNKCKEAKEAPTLPVPMAPPAYLWNWFHSMGYTDVSLETCQRILAYRDSSLTAGTPDSY